MATAAWLRSRFPAINHYKSSECARLLAEGYCSAEVARQAKISEYTLRNALQRHGIPTLPKEAPSTNYGPWFVRLQWGDETHLDDTAALGYSLGTEPNNGI